MPLLPDWALILTLTVASVFAIVTDWRTPTERRLRRQYGIDRDWWVPPVAFAIALALSLFGVPSVRTAFVEKIDIIVLIFSFGIMSEGLAASGFFRYLAYRVVDICEGNSTRLVLYLFTMTSAVTFFTTNDIVVLVVTPVIVEICFQAGIRNAKPYLLSQFVAANTLSMGLLIGSPTNIIIAEEFGIDFLQYSVLMFLPALVAFLSSFVLVYWLVRLADRPDPPVFADLAVQSRYRLPATNPEPYFTRQMRDWILVFGTFVALVAVVTFLRVSLLWCAVPSILIAVGYWWRSAEHTQPVSTPIKRLPYGVFFFGMTFFVFAEAFGRTAFVTARLVPTIEGFFAASPVRAGVLGVFGTGILVNVFNDLPAAALVATVLSRIEFASFGTRLITLQASLVGLNIGTYVTQIGALAGLIWFNQLRIERGKRRETFPDLAAEMTFPSRTDLVRYGLLHFAFTGLSVGMFLVFQWVLVSVLVGPY